MNAYKAYGLTVASDWPLPECLPAEQGAEPEIRIIKGLVPEEGIDSAANDTYEQSNGREFWLNIEGVARYWIRHGREIIIEPHQGADEESIRVFLLGSAIGALLFQRGLLLIHGNAIEVNGGCLVCVGDSGVGKSTLAAAFLQHGHRLLADDVVPVDEQGLATPGFPRIKLWGETARQFGIETEGLRRIMPDMDKYNVPLGERYCGTPMPVKWVYVLEPSESEDFKIEPFEGMARFEPLHENTYRVHFLDAMALKPQHLQQVAKLAGKIRMARIKRPKLGFRLPELVRFILDDIERHSPEPEQPMTLQMTAEISRHPDMISSEIGGEAIMMSIEKGAYFGLNPVATRIWDLIEQPQSVASLIQTITEEYDVSAEQAAGDVQEFVADMIERGIAQVA